MLISFADPDLSGTDVATIARLHKLTADVKWSRQSDVRFTLPGATTEEHDAVIKALLVLDPQARVRTSRALYEGYVDYCQQIGART